VLTSSPKLKILIVNQYAVTPAESGGTRHYTLGRELVKRGHEVVIVASSAHYQSGAAISVLPGQMFHEQYVDGVRFLRLRARANEQSHMGRLIGMLGFARALMSRHLSKALFIPDVVIGSTPQPFAAEAARRLARQYDVPFIVEVRDLWPDSIVQLAGVSRKHPLVIIMGYIERGLYRKAQHVITLLPGSASEIAAKILKEVNITVLPNMVDLSLHDAVPAESGASFTIAYAGAHGLANALDTFLDAAGLALTDHQFSNVRFLLIGEGPEKNRLQVRAEKENLTNVVFQKPVPKTQVGIILSQADAFYMPLKNVPLFRSGISPNKLFDYMAAARPVIFAVDTPANPVADAQAGVTIAPESHQELLQAIRYLMFIGSEQRHAMGVRGRRYVEDHHSPHVMGEKLEELLLELVSKHRADKTSLVAN
jgi:glycosyltransferase involved in cell wall biosynthesis